MKNLLYIIYLRDFDPIVYSFLALSHMQKFSILSFVLLWHYSSRISIYENVRIGGSCIGAREQREVVYIQEDESNLNICSQMNNVIILSVCKTNMHCFGLITSEVCKF